MGTIATHTKVIDGVTYQTTTFGAIAGCELIRRLALMVSSDAIEMLIAAPDQQIEVETEDGEDGEDGESKTVTVPGWVGVLSSPAFLMRLVTGAAEGSSEGDLSELLQLLLRKTTATPLQIGAAQGATGNVADHFDTHFAGRYMHMLEVAGWVLRLGFAVPSLDDLSGGAPVGAGTGGTGG